MDITICTHRETHIWDEGRFYILILKWMMMMLLVIVEL